MKLFKSAIRFPNINFQKKYIGFFSVVPLLLLTAFIKVPCPVCGGTGYVSTTGMGQVSIVSTESSVASVVNVDSCLVYHLYTYNVILTLLNVSKTITAQGYVDLGILDPSTGMLLQEDAYAVVTVPANQQVQNFLTVQFVLSEDMPTNAQIVANIDLSAQKCQVCGGTGKVPLNAWFLDKFMGESFNKVQQTAVTPVPIQPEITDTPEELIGQEGSTNNWYQIHPSTTP